MKRKWIAILMCICCIGNTIPIAGRSISEVRTASAATVSEKSSLESLKDNLLLMGICDSSMAKKAYNKKVTRKELAKILVKASIYGETVNEETGGTSYADLKSDNKYSAYIKTAVENQWMSGYLNGKFKPDKAVVMKDVSKAFLTLLGYTNADFVGNMVNSRMSKFNMLGLNDRVNKSKEEKIKWKDMLYLLDNLMTTEMRDGKVYAQVIGYRLNVNGEIDYNSLLKECLNGPILAEGAWKEKLPIGEKAVVYRNESVSSWESISEYDVIYYSESKNMIWCYDNKITGKITAISPDRISPETITIADNTYTLGSQEMINQFSFQGTFDINDTVTLFLGLDKEVVAAKDTNAYNDVVHGVVLEAGTRSSTNPYSSEIIEDYIVLLDSKGNQHTYLYDSSDYVVSVNTAVEIGHTEEGEVTVKKANVPSMSFYSHRVKEDGTIGEYTISPNASIIDVNQSEYERLSPSELIGVSLNSSNLLYYSCDEDKVIDEMLLRGVSGCGYNYGIVTGITSGGKMYSYTYTTTKGVTKTATFSEIMEYITEGNCYRIVEVAGNVYFSSLLSETVKELSESYIATERYEFVPNNQILVYYYKNGMYYETSISKISDLSKYTVTAYYEGASNMIPKVQCLVAKRKTL